MAVRIILDWVAALRMLVSGQKEDAKAVLHAHREVWQQRAYWRLKRKEQKNKGNFPEMPGVYRGSIVWEYFVRQKKTVREL